MIQDDIANKQVLNHTHIQQHGEGQLPELPLGDTDDTASPQKGLNLGPLLRTIQRKALLIVGITAVASVGGWISSAKSPSMYEGNFRLLVEPITTEARISEPASLTRGDSKGVPSQEIFTLDYPTQLEIIQSPKMLEGIVEQVKTKYPDFNIVKLRTGLTIERIAKTQFEKTKLIEVKYQALDPKFVEFVLQATADKYLKYSLDERKTRIGEGVRFIEDQLPGLQKRVDGLQSKMQELQKQYKLTEIKSQGDQLSTQIRQISTQQLETQRQLQEQKILYENLQRQLDLTPNEAIAASTLSEAPVYQELLKKINEVDVQMAGESARFTPESPQVQALADKKQKLISLMEEEGQRVLGQTVTGATSNSRVMAFQNPVRIGLIKQMVDTNNQINVLESRNRSLLQTRDVYDSQLRQFPAIARQYNDIQRQLEIATKTLDQLLNQRETLRVEVAQNQIPWEIVSAPQVPKNAAGLPAPAPSKPTKKIAGVVIGLVLGIATAILIEKYRNIFYTTEDIKDATKLPLLGVIPLAKNPKQSLNASTLTEKIEKFEGTESNSPDSTFTRAFDSLYANIRFLFPDRLVRSLAVCSAVPEDGKSTVAINLAKTAAAMGQQVLLVDANLRLPQIHNELNLPNSKGLTDLLANKMAFSELIMRSPISDNLFVLTSGKPIPEAARLLASGQMQSLMREFQATFDLVIYDTPHLFDLMDANFLAAHTDGILMVVGVHSTECSAVKQVMKQIDTFGLVGLGVVANYVKKDPNLKYSHIS